MKILVTGASGYIGGRLVPRLAALEHQVVCLVRDPHRLNYTPPESVEIRRGDLLDPLSLPASLQGIDISYYLVHSMADGVSGYLERDLTAASNFAAAARDAGVQHIIYLGGLGKCDKSISSHLEARQRVGDILRQSGVPVTEFRAAIIIGSGSMSFEMIRYLTEFLPVLFTPRWIDTLCQPIAIENVLDYLLLCLAEPRSAGSIFEIGGPDVLTYAEIMRRYAMVRQLIRPQIRLPFLTTGLLAFGADVVTPLPSPYLRILIEGLRTEVVVHDLSALEIFNASLIPYDQALRQALSCSGDGEISNYMNGGQRNLLPGKTSTIRQGMFIEQRRLVSAAEPHQVYAAINALGGPQGWYYANGLWQLRGWIDRLLGGVGMRKTSNSHPALLQPGAELGGYRVELVEQGHLLRLRNEMKAPGPAWMQFEVQPRSGGGSLYIQTAFFEPHGLFGLLYWYGLYPFHQLIFNGLARAILKRAETQR